MSSVAEPRPLAPQAHDDEADERQLQLLIADWRRGRANRSLWQALGDAYVMVFAVLLIGAMLISAIINAQSGVAGCDSYGCRAARGLLPWASAATAMAIGITFARMFGPVMASAAEGFWLMDAPLDRRKLLRGRLLRVLLIALLAGAIFGGLVAALTGSSWHAVLLWAAAAGLGTFGVVAIAAAQQGTERTLLTRILQWLLSLLAIGVLGTLVAISVGWASLDVVSNLGTEIAVGVAIGGLLVGVLTGVLAYSRLRNVRRQRLTSGSSLVQGMAGAAFSLDFALVRDLLQEQRARERGHVRPTRGVGEGTRALMMRDVQRLWRNPVPLVVLLASIVVPYAVEALGLRILNPIISALALMACIIPFFNSLRVLTRTKGLQRCFPFDPGEVRTAAMSVPGILTLFWAVGVMPAFAGVLEGKFNSNGFVWAFTTAIAGFLGAVRWITAQPANYSAPLVAVGTGALPPGMIFALLRGIDVIALICLPLMFGWSPWISLIMALIVFSVLRSGTSMEALQEQQAEQKRLMEEARAGRDAKKPGAAITKTKIQRKR